MNLPHEPQNFLLVKPACYTSGLSASLAPPPLDEDLSVSERMERVKECLSRTSEGPGGGVVVGYDIIQVYKRLVLSCGISLEGNCEDPKVKEILLLCFLLYCYTKN